MVHLYPRDATVPCFQFNSLYLNSICVCYTKRFNKFSYSLRRPVPWPQYVVPRLLGSNPPLVSPYMYFT